MAVTNKSLLKKCTFLANYSDGKIYAQHSLGAAGATFAATRGAANPATYIDEDGVVQVTTTSNEPRFTKGFYDTTGFVARAGVLIEGAATNLVPKSYTMNDATWDATNVTVADGATTDPAGGSNAASLTASAANGTVILATAVTAVTYSVWLKRKTGTGTINITADGTTWVAVALTSSWARFQTSIASASQKCGIRVVTDTDAIYVYGSQFETTAYATSFIPTTTTALTRNAETLKYAISGNRTATTEACVAKVTPEFANAKFSFNHISDTDTKRRAFLFSSITTNDVLAYANVQDSIASVVPDIINDSWAANASLTLGYNMQQSSPYVAGFYQGVADGTNETSDNFTTPVWGTYFWIGSQNNGTNQSNSIIQSIAFFSEVLTAEEHLWLHNNTFQKDSFIRTRNVTGKRRTTDDDLRKMRNDTNIELSTDDINKMEKDLNEILKEF